MITTKGSQHTDLDFMSDPGQWPCWPWLPMKKTGPKGDRECALLHADDFPDKPACLYKVNLYTIRTYFPTPDMEKTREYVDFQAMLDDGWMVD